MPHHQVRLPKVELCICHNIRRGHHDGHIKPTNGTDVRVTHTSRWGTCNNRLWEIAKHGFVDRGVTNIEYATPPGEATLTDHGVTFVSRPEVTKHNHGVTFASRPEVTKHNHGVMFTSRPEATNHNHGVMFVSRPPGPERDGV
eukprot:173319-Prorocentrum_minimum.AAC.1